MKLRRRQYFYDSVHRRTQAWLEDGSVWKYDYNDRNEVVAGKRHWRDWMPVAGQQFEYAFDPIGNRTQTKAGGDEHGQSLREANYANNAANEISTREIPSAVDVLGVAKATASVAVGGSAAYELGEYYHRAVPVSNGSGPVYPQVTVTATEGGNQTSDSGYSVVPAATQSFQYDADGNLTFDGVWQYGWNAENRLAWMAMTNITDLPGNSHRKKLEFTYDYLGRRVAKALSTWNGSAFANPVTTRFLYDGWNLIAEFNADLTLRKVFLWGQDLSGTMDQAGGIGGLLAVTDQASGATHFPAYDGNGNITALVSAADGNATNRYEYGPFGEPIRVSGSFAEANPFRWSTKFWDVESDLVYYGYRFYSPSLGKWLSRDPLGELGGINLYGFSRNAPSNGYDKDGRETLASVLTTGSIGGLLGGTLSWATGSSFWSGFASGAIGGLTGGTALALEFSGVSASIIAGVTASTADVYASGGNPFDGGRGTTAVLVGGGVGAAFGLLGSKFANSGLIDEDLVLDAAIELASGIGGTAIQTYVNSAFSALDALTSVTSQ
jgi:RHS repeat-associated protein